MKTFLARITRLLSPDGAAGSGSGKSNAASTSQAAPPAVAPSAGQPPAEAGSETPAPAASPSVDDVIGGALEAAHGWTEDSVETTTETESAAEDGADPDAGDAPAETGEIETEESGEPEGEKEEGDGEPKKEKGEAANEALETIKAENVQLKEKLAAATRPVLQPTPENPLANIETAAELEQAQREAQTILEFCETNPDGATVKNDKGEDVELTAEQIRQRKVSAMRIINAVPQRQEFLVKRTQCDVTAKAVYPQLFQSETEEGRAVATILKTMPWLTQFPNAMLIIGDALVGQAVRFAQAQKKGDGKTTPGTKGAQTPAPAIKPPVKPGEKAKAATPPIRPPVGATPRPAVKAAVDGARKNIKAGTPSASDVEDLIGAHLGL